VSPPRFTAEQRAAVSDRTGSALLAANAGSGKTAVMVERFVEAVRIDGVAVSAILALTFTEKAAGELRERVRRRLLELGEAEHARAVDGAWIGTIHGFCARVLRARPLAAGLDPRFEVLDEGAAGRLATSAYEAALDAWAAEHGPPAVDLAAAYRDTLRDIVVGAHDELRSRGAAPRLPIPAERPAPEAGMLREARASAARELAVAGAGVRVSEARAALEACETLLAAGGVPIPSDLGAARVGNGAKALGTAVCDAYREAYDAYRSACADHHARAALILIDALLDRFAGEYAAAKAARAGVDFEDLELGVRDLLADDAERRRWSERFALIMVDEFQDTNRLQLDLLESLERSNLFAVGDEFQSIYRFRHADVQIFRERRARLGADRVRGLRANFRSDAELLDVLNTAFAPELGGEFQPLLAGRERAAASAGDELRLFDPDPPSGDPPVELLVTDTRGWEDHAGALGLAGLAEQPWRRAEARLVAHRLREEVHVGRRPGDVVVLVRATASLRLFEQALEDQGLPTYVVGGRGYWSQEQVRDGLNYLAALANPRDEEALYGVLASPFCGVSSDALILLAQAGREAGRGPWPVLRAAVAAPGAASWLGAVPAADRERLVWFAGHFAAERDRAERLPVEALLERGIQATGYDLAILARTGGERRLANLRKLMRLARDYEHAEGRDLRGFIAFAQTQELVEAREGEAALESEGLDAVRLMTIHRAKGLEFPVVCVADLGRLGAGGRPRLLLGRDGTVGLRLAALGGGDPVPALAYERLAAEEDCADAEEERRLLYVAMTRARERLILSGGADCERWPEPRPGGAPLDWLVRAVAGDPRAGLGDLAPPDHVITRMWDGSAARVRAARNAPGTLGEVMPREAMSPEAAPRSGAPATALPKQPKVMPAPPVRPRPAPQRLSYTSLQSYARCPYRFYLQRVLRLPPEPAPPPVEVDASMAPGSAGLDPRVRGSLVHALLEDVDFARLEAPASEAVAEIAARHDVALTSEDVEDVRGLVAAFAASPLCERLAGASKVRREAGFAFGLEPGGGGPLVNGFVDVMAAEPTGRLIVDYKSDRLEGAEPHEVVERDYATQRVVYALAALRDGAPRVDVAYCFLERPAEPVIRTFTAAEAPALAEQVTTLARGVLDERYPVTDTPHRELCADCPGLRALCSHPEERTLGPAPGAGPARAGGAAPGQTSAGTLAGSGGPS
jgi:ATP-dependent helicase/nuclease subunit A